MNLNTIDTGFLKQVKMLASGQNVEYIGIGGERVSYLNVRDINHALNPDGLKINSPIYMSYQSNECPRILVGYLAEEPEADEFVIGGEIFSNWYNNIATKYVPNIGIVGRLSVVTKDVKEFITSFMNSVPSTEVYEESFVNFTAHAEMLSLDLSEAIDNRKGAKKLARPYLNIFYLPRERVGKDISEEFSDFVMDFMIARSKVNIIKYDYQGSSGNRQFRFKPREVLECARDFLIDVRFLQGVGGSRSYPVYKAIRRLGFGVYDPEPLQCNFEKSESVSNASEDISRILKTIKEGEKTINEKEINQLVALMFDALQGLQAMPYSYCKQIE